MATSRTELTMNSAQEKQRNEDCTLYQFAKTTKPHDSLCECTKTAAVHTCWSQQLEA